MLTAFLYIIPVVLIGGTIVYLFNQQHKKATLSIYFDVLRANKKQVSDEFLDKRLSYLKEWMKNSAIDAYTSAALPLEARDFIQATTKNKKKQILTYDKTNTVETPAFFLLSGADLHFININEYKELTEHIVFEEDRLQNTEMRFAGAKKEIDVNLSSLSRKDYPKVYDVIIASEKGTSVIQAIDCITNNSFANADMTNTKRGYAFDIAKGKIASEYFFEKLAEQYPHLNVKAME